MSRWVSYGDTLANCDAGLFQDWLDRHAVSCHGVTMCSIESLSRQHAAGYIRIVRVVSVADSALPTTAVARALIAQLHTDQKGWITVVSDGVPSDVDD